MKGKRIISDPTPENSPEVLAYGKDDLEKVFKKDKRTGESDEYNLVPRRFTDIVEVFPVIRGHWKNGRGYLEDRELSGEALHFFMKWDLLKFACSAFFVLWLFFVFPTIAGYLTEGVLKLFHIQDQGTIDLFCWIAFVIVFIVLFVMLMLVVYGDFESLDLPLRKYKAKKRIFDLEHMGHIPAVQWRKAMDVQFLNYEFVDSTYDSDFEKLDDTEKNEFLLSRSFSKFKKFVSEFFVEENLDTLKKIDSTELSASYNNYMEMLIFVLSNKESLSDDMMIKYIKNLDYRCDVFTRRASEAINAMTIVKKTESETQASGKRIIQDMLDEDSSNAMPLDPELKL